MSHHPDADLRTAFRDLHGNRLHGFALVLLLGDRATAAALAGSTLDAVAADAARLRHPERAAAVLRSELHRRARRSYAGRLGESDLRALAGIGIDGATARALGALRLRDRAALIATDIERFGDDDVATILGTSAARARHLAAAARQRYVEHHAGYELDASPLPGSIGERVAAVAERTIGGRG